MPLVCPHITTVIVNKIINSQNYHNFHICTFFYLLGSMDFLGWTIRWRPTCGPFSYYRRKNLELTTLKPNHQKRRKRNDANVQFYKQTKNYFKLWSYQCTSSNYDCTSIKSFPIIKSIYIRGFTKFGIKVLWRLQFFIGSRTLNLKFQEARTCSL